MDASRGAELQKIAAEISNEEISQPASREVTLPSGQVFEVVVVQDSQGLPVNVLHDRSDLYNWMCSFLTNVSPEDLEKPFFARIAPREQNLLLKFKQIRPADGFESDKDPQSEMDFAAPGEKELASKLLAETRPTPVSVTFADSDTEQITQIADVDSTQKMN